MHHAEHALALAVVSEELWHLGARITTLYLIRDSGATRRTS